ncbi:MAG TPA: ABC transporter permease [Bryobacteraceae bacterium]|nr:ABC transporter permease [Bryobacteraceae bacterium]
MRPYIALFQSNMRLTLRDRSVLFFNYIFPLIFFFGFGSLFGGGGNGISYYLGMVLTMGILGNGLWGAGMRAVQEREANILRRFKVTPITPWPILTASMAAGWLLYMPLVVVLLAVAHFGYSMPVPRQWFSLLLMVSLGLWAMRAIGLILAAVTNTMQEATILTQVFYLPMLLLSGATIPSAILPKWVQTLAEFMPASYLVEGFQGIFYRNQSILRHGASVGALLLTVALGTFVAAHLFRWEKEEKITPRNKLWALAVLAPFLVLGAVRGFTKSHLGENEGFYRDMERAGSFLIRDARIFTGDGKVIENGSVLVRDGRIAAVYEGAAPDADSLKADLVEAAGKTLLPGLIDAHVHLAAPGGPAGADYNASKAMARAAAAMLYSGVTAARSAGDDPADALALRADIASAAKLGSQIFVYGPLFTADAAHGTEFLSLLPAAARGRLTAQLIRTPKTPDDVRRETRRLIQDGVNGFTAVLEDGWGDGETTDRMDLLLARTLADEGRAAHLPLAIQTSSALDVADALDVGAASVEGGAWRDELPETLVDRMAKAGVYYDPTLSVADAYARYYGASAAGLDDSLTAQAVAPGELNATRALIASGKTADQAKAAEFQAALAVARGNLLRAWSAGVPLVMGTDSGYPLVFPGPSLHRELQLWVQAGIPAAVALQAATGNAARMLHADGRIGFIRQGLRANFVLVDGNPLQDISATERISLVVYEGERLRRGTLFDQK